MSTKQGLTHALHFNLLQILDTVIMLSAANNNTLIDTFWYV